MQQEIAGLALEAWKEPLTERDVSILVDEPCEEVRAGAELMHRQGTGWYSALQ